MFYIIAADIVVFIHFLWIVFIIFGALLGRSRLWIKRIHIGGIVFALFIQVFGWYCPLTHLETWLRSRYDPAMSYKGAFIAHYIERIVYIDLSPVSIFMLTIFSALVSLWLYLHKPGKLKSREE